MRPSELRGDRSRRLARRLWCLAILAAVAASIGPSILFRFGEFRRKERIAAEAERLGGWAGALEGGYDPVSGTFYIDVDFSKSYIDDDQFITFCSSSDFRGVLTLSLADTRITDRGIKSLERDENLLALDLSRTGVGDGSLKSLAVMRSLSNLNLSGTRVTDRGLEILRERRLPKSRMMLDATDTAVTELGVRGLIDKFPYWNISFGSSSAPKTSMEMLNHAPSPESK